MRYAQRRRRNFGRRARPRLTRQRVVGFGLLTTMVGVLLGLPAAAEPDPSTFRLQAPELGGYSMEAQASPFSVLFFETASQLPTDPGESEFQATVAYTQSELSTGPSSRAVASSSWPGGAVGDGFPTICSCDQGYFVKADAYYPAGPFEAEGFAYDEDGDGQPDHSDGGATMFAAAHALDTYAVASQDQSPNQEAAGFGNARSRSDTTVLDGVAITHVVSEVSDVDIGGVIKIKSVKTILQASSDGTAAETIGQTAVSGVEILGQAFVVDENGARPADGEGAAPPANGFSNTEGMGIEMFVASHEEQVDGAVASREAGGLVIEIDFPSFFEGMPAEVSGPVTDVVTGTVGEIPEENIRNNALSLTFAALTTGPKVRYVLARGEVYSASNPPFEFDFPAPPVLTPPGVSAPPPPASSFEPFTPDLPVVDTPPMPEQQPNVAPPETVVAGVFEAPPWFEGWYPALIALGLGITTLGAWGLDRATALAFGAGNTAGGTCSTGAPKRLPDLRS